MNGVAASPLAGVAYWEWGVVLVYMALAFVPISQILYRVGFSRWWALPAVIFVFPVLGILGLWFFAFSRWPADRRFYPGQYAQRQKLKEENDVKS